ncbi:MAG: HlyD family efflux transporter periplasmic adaptor subunit [Ignavibacteriae bacterium]|nr:HlyD family efflux transporter periplasmic adaptor subunit [Ignavibacteriota bacterium]
MKQNKKKIISVILILIVGIFGMSFLSNTDKETQKRENMPSVRTVKTELLNFSDIYLNIKGNGIIESQRTLDVVAEVSGKIDYAKNDLKDGTFLKEGEIILRLDSREIKNDLFSFRSDFMNSVASLLPEFKIENTGEYIKWKKYFSSIEIKESIPPLPEIANSKEKIRVSSRQIFTKYFNVKNQEILLSKYNVKAPFSGYIKSNGVIKNSFVSRGQHLLTIDDAYNLEIAVPLLVDDFSKIKFKGRTRVEISSDNSENIVEGKLARRDTKLDRNSQSLNVYVTFSNREMIPDFLSGNYVNVNIEGKKLLNVSLIKRHLVDNDSCIYVIENEKLNRKKIEIIESSQDALIIGNSNQNSLEIVTTILQKPLIGMPIKSINHIAQIDSSEGSILN